ncbi:hypothetical protein [Bacillus sp. T33-2]|uniref:hypothetical protein n=1 Tax=Bacillus sp. T33-2 TaxID=2054168 RepID=UPI000C78F7C3|nr:hypothetical protein [Bacillus sp. T33-2]PLR96861.1 hypothetical protein CVD19_09690 [Bacillus sp. T33-2]
MKQPIFKGIKYMLLFIALYFSLLGYSRYQFKVTVTEGKIIHKYKKVEAYEVFSNTETRTNYYIKMDNRTDLKIDAHQYKQLSEGDEIRIHKTNFGTVAEKIR